MLYKQEDLSSNPQSPTTTNKQYCNPSTVRGWCLLAASLACHNGIRWRAIEPDTDILWFPQVRGLHTYVCTYNTHTLMRKHMHTQVKETPE